MTEINKVNIVKDVLRGAGCAKIDMAFYHIEDQNTGEVHTIMLHIITYLTVCLFLLQSSENNTPLPVIEQPIIHSGTVMKKISLMCYDDSI